MELHQLRYVVEVDRLGSFTAAADALHVSQSGVSAQVAKLERELGITLFDRSARTPKLTPEGQHVLPMMVNVLADVDRIKHTSDELLGLVRGKVRIGTIIGCTIPSFLDGFAHFRNSYPNVQATTTEACSDDLLAGLLSGELDLALLAHHEPLPSAVTAVTFVDEPLAVGVPPGHPWQTLHAVDVSDLVDVDVITLAAGTGVRGALDRMCTEAHSGLRPAVEAHSPDTALALASRGAGVAVLSESMIGPPLVTVRLTCSRHAYLSVAVRENPGPAARALFRILSQRLTNTGGNGTADPQPTARTPAASGTQCAEITR